MIDQQFYDARRASRQLLRLSDEKISEILLATADALVAAIDQSIDDFTVEAIKAGREYSNHRMNQCIAVSISGASLLDELKTIAVFAFIA